MCVTLIIKIAVMTVIKQDALASHYLGWREAWVVAFFQSGDDKDAKQSEYKSGPLTEYLTCFETMYKDFTKGSSPYAGGSATPLHGDACIVAQIYGAFLHTAHIYIYIYIYISTHTH